MAAQTQFMQRRLARRVGGSDIAKLADQYRKQIEGMTSQYETEFSKYQQGVNEQLAPYEAAVKQYKEVVQPQYQSALESYNAKLKSYQEQLADLQANPVTARVEREVVGRTWYGKKKYGDVTYYDPRPIPKFEEKSPDLPNAPTAPEIAGFDTTEFEQKRKQLGEGLTREIAERKGARIGAVSRKSRTLLSKA